MSDRRQHPQVIRAKELAREAGLDPYGIIPHKDSWRRDRVYEQFMDAAFDEHFAREAVDGIYWDEGGSFYTERWDIPRRDDDCHCWYGRCKSGKRWFWRVDGEHGWADTEAQALIDGTAAIKRLAAGRRAIARFHHGFASYTLKRLNAEKRVKQWTDAPVNGSDTHDVEYLYDRYGDAFTITKKTAQRFYYVKEHVYHDEPPNIGFVPCHQVADDWPGLTWRELYELQDRLGYQNMPKFFLKPRPPFYDKEPEPEINLRQLKAEMAAAHPDKGGTSAAFVAARAAYEAAKAIASQAQRSEMQ